MEVEEVRASPIPTAKLRLLQLVSLDKIFEKVQSAIGNGIPRSKRGRYSGSEPCKILFDADIKTDRNGRTRRCWRATQKRIGTVKSNGGFEVYVWTKCANVLYLLQQAASASASDAELLRRESKVLLDSLVLEQWGNGSDSKQLAHDCGNGWCCNPSHTSIRTKAENDSQRHCHALMSLSQEHRTWFLTAPTPGCGHTPCCW
jgi:hypothetical protein